MQDQANEVKIVYTNYKGETAVRTIIPKEMRFMKSDWHPKEQWCLIAFDVEKQQDRFFACQDIKAWWNET